MRVSRALLFLFAPWPLAFADVKITSPAAGAVLPGGVAFTVSWIESGTLPSISDLSGYTIRLYSGSNAAPEPLSILVASGTFVATPNSVSVTVPLTLGGATANAYFLGIESIATSGGTVKNYSNRFTLSGMTGVFTLAVQTALTTVSGTAGPARDTSNLIAAPAPAPVASSVAGAQWAIPYDQQLGNTKYAPMQPVPPTKITATNTNPLWPTSGVTIATTFLPLPSIATTLTQVQTHLVPSHPNTVAAQSPPADAMQRFLNRWKD